MNDGIKISEMDRQFLSLIRQNVSSFLFTCGKKYDKQGLLLDVAPQDHEGAFPYFKQAKVLTLDIDPMAKANYTADICQQNDQLIPNEHFDWVVCTEVLEHTINPFAAIKEIHRILKPAGLLFFSTPFNFRIHGPLPDCWRFTKHGIKVLLKQFLIIDLNEMITDGRDLMPIHYTVVAQKRG